MTSAHFDFDLIIRGGTVIDGTGAPRLRADVGITGDTIREIGDLSKRTARESLDAGGHIVSPGFIDLLGHSELRSLIDPRLEGKIRQGVTTEVTGEGTIAAPIDDRMADAMQANTPEYRITWRTMGEFMNVLEKRGSSLNFAILVTTSNARALVLQNVNCDPSPAQLEQMKAIVDQAMKEGAFGISSALIYVPAIFAKTEEIIELSKVAARHGGVYFTHMRNEADEIDSALDEAFRIGREAKIPVHIWHLKVGGKQNWGRMPDVVAKIERERKKGLDVGSSVYPYIGSSTGLTAMLPAWTLEGGYPELLVRLKDPQMRARIAAEVKASGMYSRTGGPAGVLISIIPNPEFHDFQRKRLDEIAKIMDIDPVEAVFRLFEASPYSPAAIYFSMNEKDLQHALRTSWISVGADAGAIVGQPTGGAHPRAYGTMPRVVGHYVRDVKLFSLEEAVRKITSQAASYARLSDRGLLRPGMKADVVVFDEHRIRDVSTYEDPHHFSEGIRHVIVNGASVLRDGRMTGKMPGRVLRRGAK